MFPTVCPEEPAYIWMVLAALRKEKLEFDVCSPNTIPGEVKAPVRFTTEEILFLHSCTVGLQDFARISLVIIVVFLDLLRCLLLRILHAVLKLCE